MKQTERRVFDAVPAAEKVVSLFEPHADIIVKGGRRTHYGHKINLSTGRSALVLDVVVNPRERCLPARAPCEDLRGAADDGGYASRENLEDAKKLGVEHVMSRGMEQTEIRRSTGN